MRFTIASAGIAATALFSQIVLCADAPVVNNNPAGVTYQADFTNPEKVNGVISFTGNQDGKGITVKVDLTNFPAEGGPFLYHVHQYPIPADQPTNCTATGAHQDPYLAGEVIPCDASKPETCQTGDLSGKHGKIPANASTSGFETSYTDLYADVVEGSPSFVGNLSVVIHLANKTRIACANIHRVAGGNGGNGTLPTGTYPTPPAATNGAAGNVVAGFMMTAILCVAGILVL